MTPFVSSSLSKGELLAECKQQESVYNVFGLVCQWPQQVAWDLFLLWTQKNTKPEYPRYNSQKTVWLQSGMCGYNPSKYSR